MTYRSCAIIGCGNMAGAMLEGWLAGGLSGDAFTVVTPTRKSVPGAVELLRSVPEGRSFDAVLLGFKPHMLPDIAPGLQSICGPSTDVLSVLAGTRLNVLRRHFPAARSVVRVMPNLVCAMGQSPVAVAEQGMSETGRAGLIRFLEPFGQPEWVEEEQFDLVTALAGSGPAFVYRFIDALAAAAHDLGLPEQQAQRLAIAMTQGAASLAAASDHAPPELADRVASPGGVTRKGLDVLDKEEALRRLINDTLRAARDRSAEMAREAER